MGRELKRVSCHGNGFIMAIGVSCRTISLPSSMFYIANNNNNNFIIIYTKKYTFAPQIARKLVMAGQAGTRTTLTKTNKNNFNKLAKAALLTYSI